MANLHHRLIELSHSWSSSPVEDGAGARLLALSRQLGVRMLVTRVYPSHLPGRGSDALWRAGGYLESHTPPGWEGSDEYRYICLANNPLIRAPQLGLRRFLFSQLARPSTPEGQAYWEAWQRAGIREGLGLLAYARDGRTASLGMGFEDPKGLAPVDLEAMALVGRNLLESLLDSGFGRGASPALSKREQEVMDLVSRGMTDREIARLLSISPTTARAHVDSARAKLGAANRIEAACNYLMLAR